jgi:23S rRNA (pseudouridine1915-N3)-methyltransferase
MRILVAAIGKAKPGPHLALERFYAERIGWKVTVSEVEEKRKLSGPELRAREGELLLARVPERAVIIALDERGESLSSLAFARRLGLWQEDGRDVAFLIGGADGHGDSVREKADLILGFGAMTWPHLLIRGMLFEQLYRAQQILAGHPYHRE